MIYTLKIIYRNFRKNLSTNLINLGGLSLSITIILMLVGYCYSELTTDHHHDQVNQKYLIGAKDNDQIVGFSTSALLKEQLEYDLPEIRQVIRVAAGSWNAYSVIKKEKGDPFKTELIYADDGFLDMFKYKILKGDPSKALTDPMSVVLTKREALRIFGMIDVIDSMVIIEGSHPAKITAVIDDSEYKSFLTFNAIVSMSSKPIVLPIGEEFSSWTGWRNFLTFIDLNDNVDTKAIENKIKQILDFHSAREQKPVKLIPIKQIYFLQLNIPSWRFISYGNKSKIILLLSVSVLILIIAIINYINISSYHLKERSRQFGILKILGSDNSKILLRNILESALFFFISIWIAILFAELFKSYIDHYTGLTYTKSLLLKPAFLVLIMTGGLILSTSISILSAIKYSFSKPLNDLTNKSGVDMKWHYGNGFVIVFQFCSAIVLLSFLFLVHKQINYGSRDLGFNHENTLSIRLTKELDRGVLKAHLEQQANVEDISFCLYYPGELVSDWGSYNVIWTDGQFAELMGLKMVSGRFYNDTISSDKKKAVVNETFVRKLNLETPVGSTINYGEYEIVGVVKDFHYRPKNYPIGALAIINDTYQSHCYVKIHTSDFNNLKNTVETIEKICRNLSPDFPVEIGFLNDAVQDMYHSEIQYRRTFTFFASCAIFISCIGILAVSLFTSQRRTKEIGIRKINGAHTVDILYLLNGRFIKWVGIAFTISIPIAWYSMNKWLEGFAYKTDKSWWIFVLSGSIVLIIAMLTVSWHTLKAARRNPVEALRYE